MMRAKRCSSIWWLKRFAVALLLSALVAIPATKTAAQSAEVLQAQIELQARGYDPGSLDGFMGRLTRRALRQFQEDIGGPVTGVLDEATLETLTAPEPEPQAEPAQPHAPVLTPFPTTEQLAPTPTPDVVPDGVKVAPVQPQPSPQSETTSEPGTSVEPSPVLAPSKRAEPNDTGQYGIVVALITLAIAGLLGLTVLKGGVFSSLRRLSGKPSADNEGFDGDDDALIPGLTMLPVAADEDFGDDQSSEEKGEGQDGDETAAGDEYATGDEIAIEDEDAGGDEDATGDEESDGVEDAPPSGAVPEEAVEASAEAAAADEDDDVDDDRETDDDVLILGPTLLTHPTLDQLKALKLDGMVDAFVELQAQDSSEELGHAEWLALLADREAVNRNTNTMTDVVEIAKERIATLATEIGTLDGFVRMAEKLVKDNRLEPKKAPDTEGEKAAKSTGSGIARLYSATDGANGANGAEAEREDVPARELTAKERQQ